MSERKPALAEGLALGLLCRAIDVEVDPSSSLTRMVLGWMEAKAVKVSVIPGRAVAVVVTYMPTIEELAMICPAAAKLVTPPAGR